MKYKIKKIVGEFQFRKFTSITSMKRTKAISNICILFQYLKSKNLSLSFRITMPLSGYLKIAKKDDHVTSRESEFSAYRYWWVKRALGVKRALLQNEYFSDIWWFSDDAWPTISTYSIRSTKLQNEKNSFTFRNILQKNTYAMKLKFSAIKAITF